MMLKSIDECKDFLATGTHQEIADQLRRDQQSCKNGELPSLIAILLPSSPWLERGVSVRLLDSGEGQKDVSKAMYRLNYQSVLSGIKSHIEKMGSAENEEDELERIDEAPSTLEYEAARKVLGCLELQGKIGPESTLRECQDVLRNYANESHTQTFDRASTGNFILPFRRRCHICHVALVQFNAHPLYASLCLTCASFNIASSELSQPANLELSGKTALVTGARLNLGFHVALRLLRCGAKVIATSRYPRDAECRYRKESGFNQWEHRLKVVGADFRTAKNVFALVALVKKQVHSWAKDSRLDILINNAAQTLTDKRETERKAIEKESILEAKGFGSLLLEDSVKYVPSIRGAPQGPLEASIQTIDMSRQAAEMTGVDASTDVMVKEGNGKMLVRRRYDSRPASSWTQTLSEIPYEDLISAHSVNTFVPLILIRELLPLMGRTKKAEQTSELEPTESDTPLGYIINVTSREGLFDSLRSAQSVSSAKATEQQKQTPPQKLPERKSAHHTHTNMTKAALNMITETEAEACWHDQRVAMNSVDPGYMSAAPGFGEKQGVLDLPLTWEDGAGRVLWPVAVGWGKKEVLSRKENDKANSRVVWGKFLKHYRPATWGGEGMI